MILIYIRDKKIILDNITIDNSYLKKHFSIENIFDLLIDSLKDCFISYTTEYMHNMKNTIGFFIYKYDTAKKKGNPLFFQYDIDEIDNPDYLLVDNDFISPRQVNEVDNRKIMLMFLKQKKLYKNKYKTNELGYIVYNIRQNKYLLKCDLEGSSSSKFPDPGPGKITNEEVPGWYLPNIRAKFKNYLILSEYYDKLEQSFIDEYLSESGDSGSSIKDNYLLLLEVILRYNNKEKSFIIFNQMWLKYL